MLNKDIDVFLINKYDSAKLGMKKLDSSRKKILFVVDNDRMLVGSITDGDLRRWILSEGSLNASVLEVCNKNPFALTKVYSTEEVKRIVLTEQFSAVPILDNEKRIIDIILLEELFHDSKVNLKKKSIDIPIVIMAGGQGKRLEPFTQVLPKPLIPIGDKTIIEIIIDKFLDFGINKFYISINHKAKIIAAFFEDINPAYQIEFIYEKFPLGTIGALASLKGKLNSPILVTNCDIIINTDYSDFLEFHKENNYDISLVASLMHYKIPYGTCEIESGGKLTTFTEKPEFNFLASTGMYILNHELISLIPDDTFFHITDLIALVRKEGGTVGVFPISEDSWLDTGEWQEYKKTIERFQV